MTKPKRSQVPLAHSKLSGPTVLPVPMEYGKSQLQPDQSLPDGRIHKIQLVHTLHPNAFDHRSLNTRRIRELIEQNPQLAHDPSIIWEIMAQQVPSNDERASSYFHGFLLHYETSNKMRKELPKIETVYRLNYSPTQPSIETHFLEESIIRQIRGRLIEGDSTTFKVLERNKSKWKNTVIVCDWSSSMFPYGTQVFTWLHLNQDNKSIQGYVFFNDCDINGHQIVSGATPGEMFYSRERDSDKVLEVMLGSVRKGVDNKDLKENDLEAIQFALKEFQQVDEVVLIADNVSPVRYPELIDQINKPVRIILCGTTLNKEVAIQDHYLQLAKATGGSIHTIADDLENIEQIKEGTWIKIGDTLYKYKQGNFIPTLRKKRPRGK